MSYSPTNSSSQINSLPNQHPKKAKTDNHKHFQSGWAGYIEYPKNAQPAHETATPAAEFFYYPCSLLLDIESGTTYLQNPNALSELEINDWLAPLYKLSNDKSVSTNKLSTGYEPIPRKWFSTWCRSDYQQAFEQVQNYLKSGDCYQINLTMPFTCSDNLCNASPLPLLEAFNPRFGGYLKSPKNTLFSVSPERFIRIDGNRIETSPIKGTIPRGKTATEDLQLAQQLSSSLKNQAENLMIVDLLRNDLSINALPHSVKTEKLFELESHANVHHLVSTISAEKRPDKSAADIIMDAFPGGSITGAPKKRAMEIIAELEHQPRGLYCGSLGYFDDAGHADFNILIRSIIATKDGATCWGGGGITVDSTADDEYQEILNKVGKILTTPI